MVPEEDRHDVARDPGQKRLEIVAYIGDFKIVGTAHFGVAQRSGSRRASDYIRQFKDGHLTLSDVGIYGKASHELIEKAPFVIVNMEKVDFIYARDDAPHAPRPDEPQFP